MIWAGLAWHRSKLVIKTFCSNDLDSYRMDYREPHRELEAPEKEITLVDQALAVLQQAGVLPNTSYEHEKLLAHRAAVRELFDIPWTAITPRAQRLLYAINAIAQPRVLIAAGVFCGNTFISNAGAAVGPGACYSAGELIGVEIVPEEAARAERNTRRIDPTGVARVVAGDAIKFVTEYAGQIDLLYLDADDGKAHLGKGIYFDILSPAYPKMSPGSLVLAHNSYNAADKLKHYLEFVRNPAHFRASVNIILDIEGLEVSVK